MSAHKLKIELSSTARKNLRSILNYSGQRWGATQRARYHAQLRAGFDEIAMYPAIGQIQPEFGDGVRSRKVGTHLIIYRPEADRIVIALILHQRQDIESIVSTQDE